MERAPLVTVVIPAFNAEATVARTLQSVLAQTFEHLEVLVVDDGSTDSTPQIVRDLARGDARIRVLRQENGGVARARNLGIRSARGAYVAPVDADDLWHPTKIEKQMAVLLAADPATAFVYCASRIIDEEDRIVGQPPSYRFRGWVLHRHVVVNFVGNGSALLMRRAAVLECGGYDASLRDRGLQGAEDSLLQLQLATRYRVEVVPEYLVGYRRTAGAMSENVERMARSYITARAQVRGQCEHVPGWAFAWGVAPYVASCGLRAARRGQFAASIRLLAEGLRLDAVGTVDQVVSTLADKAWSLQYRLPAAWRVPSRAPHSLPGRPHFFDVQPTEAMLLQPGRLLRRRLQVIESYDRRAPRGGQPGESRRRLESVSSGP